MFRSGLSKMSTLKKQPTSSFCSNTNFSNRIVAFFKRGKPPGRKRFIFIKIDKKLRWVVKCPATKKKTDLRFDLLLIYLSNIFCFLSNFFFVKRGVFGFKRRKNLLIRNEKSKKCFTTRFVRSKVRC